MLLDVACAIADSEGDSTDWAYQKDPKVKRAQCLEVAARRLRNVRMSNNSEGSKLKRERFVTERSFKFRVLYTVS